MAGEKTPLRHIGFFDYLKIKYDVMKPSEVLCSYFSTCSLVIY